ncbi:hypothetical protein HRR83_002803 [Exophiala dermatitidis]|uniref:Uncharacterized protein n=2 Tax=Exophiala dermatitidis TaxID=5970 RepID=H6C0X8_EXODN|nr:uncharacterized protein HMPREF1120_05358 [Exophiala dermatitidis NIH/UT8656]KAJ4516789.1 hypothetical protein HRR75_003449 [Exophiala dermatitidis]EHY57316.1 hypothetical protein HMPREF1120_05358 [Exophiala dermatitidis NIH/UT8656]KAJ4520764.1 hypothetical protein HRR74_003765 [Exophiala dermatitidis]KAJ4521906.1 hypothetical protein HRR73_003105 [Exophiala dermatitidis]KAJ4537586.1 hypothetical protein HRR76_005580 [Exophiala dermatitidis]
MSHLHSPLVPLRIPNIHGLKARFAPFHAPKSPDQRIINDRFNPRRLKLLHQYSKILPDTLQWSVVSAVSTKTIPKAVMRNRLKRRWANAFADALRNTGYHANGRRLDGPKHGQDYKVGLKGTFEIHAYSKAGLTLGYHELVSSSEVLVKALEQQIQKVNFKRSQPTAREEGRLPRKSAWSTWEGSE